VRPASFDPALGDIAAEQTPAQQSAAQQVFMRLTATSSEGVDSADRASRAELTEGKSAAEAQRPTAGAWSAPRARKVPLPRIALAPA
jgi:hypothetical protein